MKNITFVVKHDFHAMAYSEVHPEIELYYVRQGERLCFVENRTYHMTAGTSMLISSNRIHKSSAAGADPHERMLLEIHPDLLRTFALACPEVSFDYLLSQTAVIAAPDNPCSGAIAALFEEIARLYEEKPFGYEAEVQCNVFKLFLQFHRSLSTAVDERVLLSPKHRKIYEVAEYISANMGDIASLDDLCAHFFISKYYLCHCFKEVTGLSVIAFLNMTRVLRACVLLKENKLSVAQIAQAVGLGSVSHFTDVFKRIEGITPHEYRKQLDRSPWALKQAADTK